MTSMPTLRGGRQPISAKMSGSVDILPHLKDLKEGDSRYRGQVAIEVGSCC